MNNCTDNYWKDNDAYHERQGEVGSIESNIEFFYKVLIESNVTPKDTDTIVELGSGKGRNVEALYNLGFRDVRSVEINPDAASHINQGEVFVGSVFDNPFTADVVFTKGLAIHIHPDEINKLYDVMYKASNKYILMCEYFSPRREMIEYRGEKDKLWKANFYEEIIERHRDLELVSYGFCGKWDEWPQDNLNWWLLRKQI
jgi:pseudaminic acid biosynthesis-associated methylase